MVDVQFYVDLYKHFVFYKLRKNKEKWVSEQVEIPRTIHYCWFGKNPVTPLMKRCIESWKQHLPDFTFQLWNEENFPIEEYPFAAQAYEQKKWAFVSDVTRLHALYYYGGVYLDTDVELLRDINPFLQHNAFTGYESRKLIPTGILGAKKGHPWIHLLLSWYDYYSFKDAEMANTRIISKITGLHYGISLDGQSMVLPDEVYIYPERYFCPRETISKDSVCIHHFAGSWKEH